MDSNKKNKKKKKKKKPSRRSKHDESTSEEESDNSFDQDFDNAVLDTNLDTAADRQLKQLAEIQAELNELKKVNDDDHDRGSREGGDRGPEDDSPPEDDDPFLPPSNQEVQLNHNPLQVLIFTHTHTKKSNPNRVFLLGKLRRYISCVVIEMASIYKWLLYRNGVDLQMACL